MLAWMKGLASILAVKLESSQVTDWDCLVSKILTRFPWAMTMAARAFQGTVCCLQGGAQLNDLLRHSPVGEQPVDQFEINQRLPQ